MSAVIVLAWNIGERLLLIHAIAEVLSILAMMLKGVPRVRDVKIRSAILNAMSSLTFTESALSASVQGPPMVVKA